jgi:hypothetical protein
MEPKTPKEQLEEFLQEFLKNTNEFYWYSTEHQEPLDKLEALDNQVQGDNHPEILQLIMDTYNKVQRQNLSK